MRTPEAAQHTWWPHPRASPPVLCAPCHSHIIASYTETHTADARAPSALECKAIRETKKRDNRPTVLPCHSAPRLPKVHAYAYLVSRKYMRMPRIRLPQLHCVCLHTYPASTCVCHAHVSRNYMRVPTSLPPFVSLSLTQLVSVTVSVTVSQRD